jgi:hypothetical protein
MWKIFEHKNNEATKEEKNTNEASELIQEPHELVDSEPIDVRLNVLNDYLKQCKDNGIEITPEMAEKEISENLGLNISELLDTEIKDDSIRDVNTDIAAQIEAMMNQKATNQGTALSFLRDKVFKSNFAKAAFVTTILFLKFSPSHAATDIVKDKDSQKTEFKKPVQLDGGDDKTYKTSAEDFNGAEKKITIKAGSFFETDKAEIKNQSELEAKFDSFFSSINSHNFEKIMDHNWIFSSSSDERKTSNWGGSNKNLSDARFAEFKKAFEEARSNHTFSNLSEDQVKQILDKPILNVQPEDGVTHITDLVNPKTNQNYTEKEVKALDAGTKDKLLEKCRYANFEVESTMFSVGPYGQFILLVDDSPSMRASKANMAEELRYVNKDMPVKIGFFSGALSDLTQVGGTQEAADKILKMTTTGSGAEKALSSAIQYLEKIPENDASSKTMYVATDEGLQDLDKIYKLTSLAEKNNTQVTFLMFYENGSKFVKIDANGLLEKVKHNTENNIKIRQQEIAKNVAFYEKEVSGLAKDIKNTLKGGSFNVSAMYDALEKDGIKGNAEEIANAVAKADFRDLKNFEKISLGKRLVNAKQRLMTNESLLFYLQQPIEKQIDQSGQLANNFGEELQLKNVTSLTNFEDAKGNQVEIPIL